NNTGNMFHHYRFMNLEHVQNLVNGNMALYGDKPGKFTIEFRNIRPYKSPEHAHAMVDLLLNVMEKLAQPDFKVPVREISAAEYARFHGVMNTEGDWADVKKELGLPENKLQDEMISEYVENLRSKPIKTPEGLLVLPAYSPKEKKGTYFEVVGVGPVPPLI